MHNGSLGNFAIGCAPHGHLTMIGAHRLKHNMYHDLPGTPTDTDDMYDKHSE